MNDRELLEDAAKAAGSIDYYKVTPAGLLLKGGGIWSPLLDDGDALRLAVKLHLDVCQQIAVADTADVPGAIAVAPLRRAAFEPHGTDPYAATRRAIVRSAAEIGRSME